MSSVGFSDLIIWGVPIVSAVLVVVYRWRRWKRERSTEEPPRPAQMTTTPQAQGADPQAPSPPDSEALGECVFPEVSPPGSERPRESLSVTAATKAPVTQAV
jgi:transposase-like protein